MEQDLDLADLEHVDKIIDSLSFMMIICLNTLIQAGKMSVTCREAVSKILVKLAILAALRCQEVL